MKLMIASDIHGSVYWCEKLIETFRASQAERMLLAGDLLYHGPRNDLPEGYMPKGVIEILNGMRNELICVRGNCEAEVDQMVLRFPVMADYCVIPLGERILYMTHGHVYGKDNPPPLKNGDILLCGHTHVPAFEQCGNYIYINPGSVSIPKAGSLHSCILWENHTFSWIDLATGETYRTEYID